jgi:hypothetical protein
MNQLTPREGTIGKRLPSISQHNFCQLFKKPVEENLTSIGLALGSSEEQLTFVGWFGSTEVTALIPHA